MRPLLGVLLVLVLFASTEAYKILVYNPKVSHSRNNFLGFTADILADAGHNVTALIAEVGMKLKDGAAKANVIRVHCEAAAKERAAMTERRDYFASENMDFYFNIRTGLIFAGIFGEGCRAILDEPGLVEKLTAEKYDVLIAENFDLCGTGLSHIIKPKATILLSTTFIAGPQFAEFGVPASLSFNPSAYMSSMNVHSMWDRIVNIYADFLFRQFVGKGRDGVLAVFREKYGADFPSLEEISSRAAYVMINAEPLIDFASPTLNKIVTIGGIGAKPAEPLDKYWAEVLGRREKNVFISFGSLAKSKDLKPQIKKAFLKTVSAFPDVTFIWKYENEEDDFVKENRPKHDNLVFAVWAPQSDLLAHPNMSVFISHGGMGSVMETALGGAPALLIPLFGDQPRTAAAMEYNGLGKVFEKFDMNDDKKLTAALKELLDEDKGYKKRAIRMAKMLAAKPFKAKEILIKHVEFAAEFGPSTALRPQSYDMTFIEYNNLDILFLALLIAFVLIYFPTRFVCRRICKRFAIEEKEKKA